MCVTALAVPALNNLFFGWGSVVLTYFSSETEALGAIAFVFGVIYKALRAAALGCTILTLGYYAARTSFRRALRFVILSSLFALVSSLVSLGLFALTIKLRLTDSSGYVPFSDRFLPYVWTAAADLLLLFLILALFTLFFRLIWKARGTGDLLAPSSPFMATAYVLFGAYTLFTMYDALKAVIEYEGGGKVFSSLILPFLSALAYGCVMTLAAFLYRAVLRKRYAGEETGSGAASGRRR